MGLKLTSPVAKIPFGIYKGWMLWMAPVSWFRWAVEQDCDDDTLDTLADALRMKEEEGSYAVLRKQTKFNYKLISIHTTRDFALAKCKQGDYVYAIIKPLHL